MRLINNNLAKNLILTAIYAIFTLIIVLHHEIWADEAQVWLICKNLNVFQLFHHLTNEGHPSFFYLLVMPFAKILHGTNSILAMQLICWASSCAAVFLLWQFSPFNKWAKAAITLSAGFLYFMPVIARSYSLIPLIVFLLAIFYPKRHEKSIIYGILIAICANIHVIMFGFCAMLAIMFFYEVLRAENNSENKTFWRNLPKTQVGALAIMFFGLIAVILQLHGTTSSNAFIEFSTENLFGSAKRVLGYFFMNAYDAGRQEVETVMIPAIGVPAIIASVVIYAILWIQLLLNSKKMFFTAFLGVAFQLFIYIFTYSYWVLVPRIFCAHLILLFAFWVVFSGTDCDLKSKFSGKNAINILIAIFFFVTTLNGLKHSILDVFNNYSASKETAAFIDEKIDPKTSVLIADNPIYCISVVYYLKNNKIYSSLLNENVKYVKWDEKLWNLCNEYFWTDYMQKYRQIDKNKRLFLILSGFHKYQLKISEIKGFKKVFQSKPTIIKREEYVIYEYEG